MLKLSFAGHFSVWFTVSAERADKKFELGTLKKEDQRLKRFFFEGDGKLRPRNFVYGAPHDVLYFAFLIPTRTAALTDSTLPRSPVRNAL